MTGIRATATDLWTVAQTCWGEARGEGSPGIYAVAYVVRNRQDFHPRWKGMSLSVLCLSHRQFSCWNPHDPNLPKMRDVSLDDRVFCQCLIAAIEVMSGMVMSSVGRSTHYYVSGSPMPKWANGQTPFCQIGSHLFFEGVA